MKLNPETDLLQTEIPTNNWLFKNVKNKRVIRAKSVDLNLPLDEDSNLVMKKLIDFVRWSQDPVNNPKNNPNRLRPAVGLAAPQIGSNTNMFFVRFEFGDDESEEFAIINPKITGSSKQIACLSGGEGCLSVDVDRAGLVPRSFKIEVSCYDYFKKEQANLVLRGYRAIVFQHEIDHLNGGLYYDKINKENPDFSEKDWIFV